MLEHELAEDRKVIGVSLDGYGYGQDGGAWGGEILLSDYLSFRRVAHFRPVPLPGGDRAAREPWRMALAYLHQAYGRDIPAVPSLNRVNPTTRQLVLKMITSGLKSPPTSSCGRLFDAVSHLVGLAPAEVEFEAEAPLRLEAVSKKNVSTPYPFEMRTDSEPWQLSFAPTIRGIVKDIFRKASVERVSASFHRTLAEAVACVCERAREVYGVSSVALVGGVFLNKTLLTLALRLLKKKGFEVLRPLQYSPNDESISLGQIAHALARLKAGR